MGACSHHSARLMVGGRLPFPRSHGVSLFMGNPEGPMLHAWVTHADLSPGKRG